MQEMTTLPFLSITSNGIRKNTNDGPPNRFQRWSLWCGRRGRDSIRSDALKNKSPRSTKKQWMDGDFFGGSRSLMLRKSRRSGIICLVSLDCCGLIPTSKYLTLPAECKGRWSSRAAVRLTTAMPTPWVFWIWWWSDPINIISNYTYHDQKK